MSICPACNTENLPGMVFCVHCGGPLDKDEATGVEAKSSQTNQDLEVSEPSEAATTAPVNNTEPEAVIAPDAAQSDRDLDQFGGDEDDGSMTDGDEIVNGPSKDAEDEFESGSHVDTRSDDADATSQGESNIEQQSTPGTDAQSNADENIAHNEPGTDQTAETEPVTDDDVAEQEGETDNPMSDSNAEWAVDNPGKKDQEPTFENEIIAEDNDDSNVGHVVKDDDVADETSDASGVKDGSDGRLDPLSQLPGAEPGPVSPLQLKDGGEAIYGERWWLRPETVIMDSPEEAADGKATHIGEQTAPEKSGVEAKAVRTPRSVIELDRRRFDELPTLEESEKKGGWAIIVGVIVAAIIGILIFTQ